MKGPSLAVSDFIDDNSQREDEWHILSLLYFDTIFITDGEELLRNGRNEMVGFLDFEFTRSEVALDFEFAKLGFYLEFLATDEIHFTSEIQTTCSMP